MPEAIYEVMALRYATRPALRRDNFLGGDPHDGDMPMDYFIWVVRNADRTILVDTGFNEDMAASRGRILLRRPTQCLEMVGIAPDSIREIIITHLHNDHVGTFGDYPNAIFHLQDDEMSFATGRHMCHARLRRSYEVSHITGMVGMVFNDRVVFHKGNDEIAPGITVHQIGGHSPGLQAVRVMTKRGWLVLASDASHYYEHFETQRCFPVVVNVAELLEGYKTLLRLAESPQHIIPGHDPLVLRRYPPMARGLEGAAVRLDVNPST